MLLYNGQYIKEQELTLSLSNRCFQYNDGFFETMILVEGNVRFWEDHLDRMKEAASILKIDLPEDFFQQDFALQVSELAQQNCCWELARIKLKVWRAGAGLYTPQTDTADWLITAQPGQALAASSLKVGICQSVKTLPSPFSAFKGFNSPVYVLASRERAERGLDDVILEDPQGNLSELTASNLFWMKEQTLYTPALNTGCLNGIMRRNLLRIAKENGWQVQEGSFSRKDLINADLVFSGNVTGLRSIASLENQELNQDTIFLAQIQRQVFKSNM